MGRGGGDEASKTTAILPTHPPPGLAYFYDLGAHPAAPLPRPGQSRWFQEIRPSSKLHVRMRAAGLRRRAHYPLNGDPPGPRPPAVPGSIRSGKGAELPGELSRSRREPSLMNMRDSAARPLLAPHSTPRVSAVGTQGLNWTPSSSPPSRETCH